ncbi:hypothetical protein SAMN05446037_100283 [Anaerovirgula multivorans]|uniref:Uncharacterized protein n=1 Tax=Anaerovirgula multivorans TaxID=312168 RepID=A0A239ALC3_9FIRM|nr:hypothetical protein [Anaerovirgula multivorans]SNR95733.1 hypothetical protein SAMN05446037_100283 [Anaerovirgula multivorans]
MCYRMECVKQCDVYKKQTCQYKLNKKQLEYKMRIKRYTCMDCGEKMIKARYGGIETMICTHCNHILQEVQREYGRGIA